MQMEITRAYNHVTYVIAELERSQYIGSYMTGLINELKAAKEHLDKVISTMK